MLTADDTAVAEAPAPTTETPAPAPAKPRKRKAKAAPTRPVKARAAAKRANGKAKARAKARAPRTVDPAKLDQWGFRKDTIKSRAAAMYASKKGATLGEVKAKLKSVQFNMLTELESRGYKIDRTHEDGEGNRKVTRFKIHPKK